MTLEVRFDEDAAAELAAVASWYEGQRPALGARFLDEVERAVGLASTAPAIGRLAEPPTGARRLLVRHFPIVLRYVVEGGVLRVLAVAHEAANR